MLCWKCSYIFSCIIVCSSLRNFFWAYKYFLFYISTLFSMLRNSYVEFSSFLSYSLTISFDEAMSGVACDLNSRGFHVLCKATEEVVGHVKPYSITGSLPLIRELQVIISHSSMYFSGSLSSTYPSLSFFFDRMKDLMFKLQAMV